MSAAGLRVAVTRDDRADGAMARALEALGFHPVSCAVIREEAAPDDGALALAAASLESYDWIVVSSARAVRAVSAARGARAWPRSLRGGAAGTSTAQALGALGLTHVITGNQGGAEALLAALLRAEEWPGTRVLAPRAAEGRRVVEAGLRAAGAHVDEPIAYRTAAVSAAVIRRRWHRGSPQAAVIASPSAARSLVGALGAGVLRELKCVVAIGPTTAAALRELEVPARVAPAATFEAAAQTLREDLAHPGGSS